MFKIFLVLSKILRDELYFMSIGEHIHNMRQNTLGVFSKYVFILTAHLNIFGVLEKIFLLIKPIKNRRNLPVRVKDFWSIL